MDRDRTFTYVRLYADENGISHFEDVTVPFEMLDYAPPAAPLGVSDSWVAESILLISQASGWHGDWHPTPRRQFAILLSRTQELTAGDGEVRVFGPGDVGLLEDTSGRGHVSKVTSSEDSVVMMVSLPSE